MMRTERFDGKTRGGSSSPRNVLLWLCAVAVVSATAASCSKQSKTPAPSAATMERDRPLPRPDPPASQPSGSAPAATRPAGQVWKVGQTYLCRRAAGTISINSAEHPEQWKDAMVIRDFVIPVSGKPAASRTVARMLWDDENLYVNVTAHDVDLRGTLKGQFARLWTEDAVELFLKPPAGEGYYEFEMSPTNVLLDLEIPVGRHTSYEQRASWESHARLAVAVTGTLEQPDDVDESYRLVMAIPWKGLTYGGKAAPKPGEKWRFIFARCDLSKAYGDKQELSACIRLPKIDFHAFELYPQMEFAK